MKQKKSLLLRRGLATVCCLLMLIGSVTPMAKQQNVVSAYAAEEGVEGFINRLYELILDRVADEEGLGTWTNLLLTGQRTGAGVAEGFILSDEFLNKSMSDKEFVEIMYRTFLDREADENGLATWLGMMEQGYIKKFIFSGFANSDEFQTICDGYGIERGFIELSEEEKRPVVPEDELDVSQFVERLYSEILGRAADAEGLNTWVTLLENGEYSGAEVAEGFIMSKEFINTDMTDEEFVHIMYRTFFGREADEGGLFTWLDALDYGYSKQFVFAGFANSTEFGALCEEYGIEQGSVENGLEPAPEPTDKSCFEWKENADGTLTITKWLGGGMEEAVIPAEIDGKTVTVIGRELFYTNGSIKKVILPNTITRIEEYAFCNCGITEISIPNSVQIIEPDNFEYCRSLASLYIPASVISFDVVGDYQSAISHNDSLEEINVSRNNPVYTSVDGILYSKDMTTLITVPDAWSGIVVIPETVASTVLGAFDGCKNVTKIVIPATVDNFDGGYGTGLCGLYALEGYEVAEEHNYLKSVDGALLSKDGTKLIHVPTLVAGESYEIPGTVSVIFDEAFCDCLDLKQLEVPAAMEFYEHEWVAMQDATYTEVPYNIFYRCGGMECITVEEGSDAYFSRDGMLYSADGKVLVGIPNSTKHTDYVVPEGVEEVAEHAHTFGAALKSITLPSSIKTIHPDAFNECKLEQITFLGAVESVGGYAFYATNLTSVAFSEGLQHIGNNAFGCCYGLAEVRLPGSLTKIGTGVFGYCYALDNLVIPEGVQSLGDNSFYMCTGLTNVKLPASLTSIEDTSFNGCRALRTIYAPVGSYAEQWAQEKGYTVINY